MTGDKFDINVVDLWSSSSPWPLCNMPKSYFFLVKHPWLWRMSFRCSEPELLHEAMFTVRDPSHCHSLSLHVVALCVHVLLAAYFFNGWILTQLFCLTSTLSGIHSNRWQKICAGVSRIYAKLDCQRSPFDAACACKFESRTWCSLCCVSPALLVPCI